MNNDEKSVGKIEYEVSVLVRRATSAVSHNKLGPLDRAAYLLLREINERGQLGVKALGEEFHLDVSTVSRQIAVLETKGYVKRSSDPSDGRASYFEVTNEGLTQLEESRNARFHRFSELLKDWSIEECQRFQELLTKFNRTFID